MSVEDQPVGKYILVYAAYYITFMIIANVLVHSFKLDVGSSMNFIIVIGASYASMVKFVTDLERAPTIGEKRKLSLYSLIVSFLVSILGLLILFSVLLGIESFIELWKILNSISIGIWAVVFVGVSLLYYLILNIVFGWCATKYVRKI